MGSHNKTFNTVCRVCLNHEKIEKMVSLVDSSQANGLSFYGSTLEEISNISVIQNPYLPINLCQKCKQSLEGAKTFTNACKVSDRKLKKLVEFSQNQGLDGAMVEEVIRQYTLFLQKPENSDTCDQSSTSQYDLMKKHKTDMKCPKIKTEIEEQALSSSNCSNFDSENPTANEDVDIFINSVKKVISNKEDRMTERKPRSKKTTSGNHQSISESHIPSIPKDTEDLTCKICLKVLTNKTTFKNHILRHGICQYVCDKCGKSFPINAELVQHQIHLHGASSKYECDVCSYRAVKKIQLIEHIRLHTGERPFTCEKCGLTFRRKTLYNKHSKFHGERTIQCDYCPRKFFVRSAMLAHRNSRHKREFFYLCSICNVTYAMAKTVKKHILDKHGIPRHLQGKVHKTYKVDTRNSCQNNVDEEDFMC